MTKARRSLLRALEEILQSSPFIRTESFTKYDDQHILVLSRTSAEQMQLGYAFRTWVPGNGVLECRLDEAQLQRVLEHNAISQHLLSELTERFLQEYDWSRAERTWPPGFSSE